MIETLIDLINHKGHKSFTGTKRMIRITFEQL
jgi:hypothetical protein